MLRPATASPRLLAYATIRMISVREPGPEHRHGRTMELMPVVASDGLPRGIVDDELAVEAGDR